jgi:sec-independent protein translocase protein TatC
MARRRKTAVVISVVLASALIPSPDIITVLLMATPVYLLYETSTFLVWLVEWRRSGRSVFREIKGFVVVKLAAVRSAGRRLSGAGK